MRSWTATLKTIEPSRGVNSRIALVVLKDAIDVYVWAILWSTNSQNPNNSLFENPKNLNQYPNHARKPDVTESATIRFILLRAVKQELHS